MMLSSDITNELAHGRAHDLLHEARRGAGAPARVAGTVPAELTIRLARDADRAALDRLSQLDSRPLPSGDLLVGEVEGELRAAVGLGGGEVVADPFHPTAAIVSLLALRAQQLRVAQDMPATPARRRHLVLAHR
jgi:hypothetical protein